MQPPRQPSTLFPERRLYPKQVNQVLAIADLKVWVFESPSNVDSIGGWAQWQYFQSPAITYVLISWARQFASSQRFVGGQS